MKHSYAAVLAALTITIPVPAGAEPASQTVQVWSYGFSPRPLRLAANQPVTLIFVNRSGGGHDFTAPTFFASSTITRGAAPGGEIELRGHESRSVTLIPRAGIYHAHCSHFFHAPLGMTDEIVVQ